MSLLGNWGIPYPLNCRPPTEAEDKYFAQLGGMNESLHVVAVDNNHHLQ